MGGTASRLMEPQEFLEWRLDQEERHELVDGVPARMMAGAAEYHDQEYHDQIVTNVIISLGTQLRGKPCRVTTAGQSGEQEGNRSRQPRRGSPPPCGEGLGVGVAFYAGDSPHPVPPHKGEGTTITFVEPAATVHPIALAGDRLPLAHERNL